jgi:ATP-dependent protease ClpP protease subunit
MENLLDQFSMESQVIVPAQQPENPQPPNPQQQQRQHPFMIQSKTKPVVLVRGVGGKRKLTVYISNILKQSDFVEFEYVMGAMGPEDEVQININSFGGCFHTCIDIISAIKHCKAKVTTNNMGFAFSSGFMIWIHGDILKFSDTASFMAHMTIQGAYDKSLMLKEKITRSTEVFKYLLEPAIQKNILTEGEVNDIFDRKCDVFILADEMKRRLSGCLNTNMPEKQLIIVEKGDGNNGTF